MLVMPPFWSTTFANPVFFDGTNDYLTRGATLTGIADGKIVLFSCWFRIAGGSGTERRLLTIRSGTATRLLFNINTSNKLSVIGRTSAPADTLVGTGATAITNTNWHHAFISVDLANSSNRALYLDGVSDSPTWLPYNNNNIDLDPATPEVVVGGYNPPGSGLLWNGDMADMYFTTPGSYYDPTSGSNLAKFISAGSPVDLGPTGTNPTGSQPLVCLNAATLAAWHTNNGSGGGFTENGALTAGTKPVRL